MGDEISPAPARAAARRRSRCGRRDRIGCASGSIATHPVLMQRKPDYYSTKFRGAGQTLRRNRLIEACRRRRFVAFRRSHARLSWRMIYSPVDGRPQRPLVPHFCMIRQVSLHAMPRRRHAQTASHIQGCADLLAVPARTFQVLPEARRGRSYLAARR